MKLVVDMLGGDLGIASTYEGLRDFLKLHNDVEVIAVGPSTVLNNLNGIKVIEANEAIKMDAHAMELLHDENSSMAKAVNAMRTENADALISCGGTGALLTLASLRIKKLDNVIRPALISPIPTLKENKKTVLLDLGANSENKVEELVAFAKMAKIYYEAVYKTNPQIALLSNGKEEEKGSMLVRNTHEELKKVLPNHFVGNIESNEILKGNVDIIVTDGYTGNIALKSIEGVGSVVKQLLKDTFKKSLKNKLAYLVVKNTLKEKMNMLSSKPLGGAMFIGLKKVVIKAHGNSDAIAFKNALETAYQCVKNDLVNKIAQGITHE